KLAPLGGSVRGDVEGFDLSRDGRMLAFVSNESGVDMLHLLDAQSGKELPAPKLPVGVIGSMKWHANGRDFAFSLSSAKSPNDCYSLDTKTGRIERWTDSETGGLEAGKFVEPELVKLKSFDGLEISGFLYRPDSKEFPGPR